MVSLSVIIKENFCVYRHFHLPFIFQPPFNRHFKIGFYWDSSKKIFCFCVLHSYFACFFTNIVKTTQYTQYQQYPFFSLLLTDNLKLVFIGIFQKNFSVSAFCTVSFVFFSTNTTKSHLYDSISIMKII